MPIQVLNYRDGSIVSNYHRSPVVTLVTDAASVESIPAEVRPVADRVITANVDNLRSLRIPDGSDGVLVWLEGDQLLDGTVPILRKNLRLPGRRTFIPVHYPYLDEADLIVLQPRSLAKGRPQDYWGFNLRILNRGTASEKVLFALRAAGEPWAQLSVAVLREIAQPGAGAEGLLALWQDASKIRMPPVVTALVLRNLIVVLMRHQDFARARQLLELGMKTYEGYAELLYLSALLCLRDGQPARAVPCLQRMNSPSRAFIGSGGENTYRLSWLLGLCELGAGDERQAFDRFMASAGGATTFAPAAEQVVKLRAPHEVVEKRQWSLCRMVRREPQLLDKIFEYLLQHRAFPAARRLADTLTLPEETRAALRERLTRAAAPFHSGSEIVCGKAGVVLEGPFLEYSSLARINREIATSLIQDSRFDVALEATAYRSVARKAQVDGDLIRQGLNHQPARLDLTVRHQWPPNFTRPSRGKLAVILPWEYGAVPRAWVDQINRNVDELWVPSRFVRDVVVRGGVADERVRVIPNGIDPNLFTPKGPWTRPRTVRGFMFLFVGGAIRRKGIDLLLQAYGEAFDPGDDVSLLLAPLGSQGAYQHNSLLDEVMSSAWNPSVPHLEVLTGELDDATLASLYRGCDAFVLPYRAEGFCMPALEAMACGKPVITTALGPSQDFCSPATAYLVSGRECQVLDDPPAFGEFAGEFTWFEPDVGDLVRSLRRVYQNREEAARRGVAAAEEVGRRFAWSRITRVYRERIAALTADARLAGQCEAAHLCA